MSNQQVVSGISSCVSFLSRDARGVNLRDDASHPSKPAQPPKPSHVMKEEKAEEKDLLIRSGICVYRAVYSNKSSRMCATLPRSTLRKMVSTSRLFQTCERYVRVFRY